MAAILAVSLPFCLALKTPLAYRISAMLGAEMQEFHSFAPIVPPQARILLLGSMPSTRSIDQQQYYAHPQNAFWPILARIYARFLGPKEAELWQQGRHSLLPFQQKLMLLEQAGIALWDILSSCHRKNSADHSIRHAVCNPIAELVEKAAIQNILLNGQKSATLFYKHITLQSACRVWTLPSSSPANATISFEQKCELWGSALQQAALQVYTGA